MDPRPGVPHPAWEPTGTLMVRLPPAAGIKDVLKDLHTFASITKNVRF